MDRRVRLLSQPGQQDIQTDLFYDYRTNVASYPAWQDWLRRHQPLLLVLWGRYDPSFQVEEAEAYRRDVPAAEVHMLDAGHFALDEQPDAIADLTRAFLDGELLVPGTDLPTAAGALLQPLDVLGRLGLRQPSWRLLVRFLGQCLQV